MFSDESNPFLIVYEVPMAYNEDFPYPFPMEHNDQMDASITLSIHMVSITCLDPDVF